MGNCCLCLRKKKNIITNSSDRQPVGIVIKSISSSNSNHVPNDGDQGEVLKKQQQINLSPFEIIRKGEGHEYSMQNLDKVQTLQVPTKKLDQSSKETTEFHQLDRQIKASPNRQEIQINKIEQKSNDPEPTPVIEFSDYDYGSQLQNAQTTPSDGRVVNLIDESLLSVSSAGCKQEENPIIKQHKGDQDSQLQFQKMQDIPLLLGGQFEQDVRWFLSCQYCHQQEGNMTQLKCEDLYHKHCLQELLEKLDSNQCVINCQNCSRKITSDVLKMTDKSFKHRIIFNNQLKLILQQNLTLVRCQKSYCSFFWKQDNYSKDESYCPYHHF